MKLLPPIDAEDTPLPSDLSSAENMRRAMRRISERPLAMAAGTDANLGHAIRCATSARRCCAKPKSADQSEPRKPLLNTTGLWPLRSASMSGVDVKRSVFVRDAPPC